MVKTLARSIREFKKPAILTPLLVTVEVILECIIPFTIANLVNEMQAGCGMDVIVRYGVQLIVMAVLSLVFGVAAGNTCATASTGFADVYKRQSMGKRWLPPWKWSWERMEPPTMGKSALEPMK